MMNHIVDSLDSSGITAWYSSPTRIPWSTEENKYIMMKSELLIKLD